MVFYRFFFCCLSRSIVKRICDGLVNSSVINNEIVDYALPFKMFFEPSLMSGT